MKKVKISLLTTVVNTKLKKKEKTVDDGGGTPTIEQKEDGKTRNKQKYNEIHRTIRRNIKEAKTTFLEKGCIEIEELQARHDTFHFHGNYTRRLV